MRIACLTTDEINEDLALRLAAECGVTVRFSASDNGPRAGEQVKSGR
jgi:hypothetical protein